MRLDNKVALVTGASRGIGKAIALKLGTLGATVIGTATTSDGAGAISQMLREKSMIGQGMVLDVRSDESVTACFDEIVSLYAAPLILVNNAGITKDNLFLRMKPEQWDAVIDTNLNSVFRVTKAALKAMFKSRWGRIVNITSVVGVSGNPGQANYCAAKAGVVGMTKSLAIEMAGAGITVNCVAPGFVNTEMTAALTEAQRETILSHIPMKRIGEPEEIASAVSFLVSAEATYITGQTIHVNGGMYAV